VSKRPPYNKLLSRRKPPSRRGSNNHLSYPPNKKQKTILAVPTAILGNPPPKCKVFYLYKERKNNFNVPLHPRVEPRIFGSFIALESQVGLLLIGPTKPIAEEGEVLWGYVVMVVREI
jgi:hypothetical protein